jgi:hypothetical protein
VIVLDEHLNDERIIRGMSFYPGQVRMINELAPEITVIKDPLIPRILYQHRGCTFVTINDHHFWRVVDGHPRYAVVAIDIPAERVLEVPVILHHVLQLDELRTKQQRCGKVIYVGHDRVCYYERRSEPGIELPFSW